MGREVSNVRLLSKQFDKLTRSRPATQSSATATRLEMLIVGRSSHVTDECKIQTALDRDLLLSVESVITSPATGLFPISAARQMLAAAGWTGPGKVTGIFPGDDEITLPVN